VPGSRNKSQPPGRVGALSEEELGAFIGLLHRTQDKLASP
jgi:hypothetical protein